MLGFKNANDLRNVFAGVFRPYTYSTPITTVAASGSVQATTSIDSSTDFICTALTARVLNDTTQREVDFFVNLQPRLEIIDQGSGSTMFDRTDVIFSNAWGNAEYPFELVQPHRFIARSVITTIMINVDTAIAYRIQVAFLGYKIPAGRAA